MTDLVKMMIGASVGSLITYGIMKSKNEEDTKKAVKTAVKKEKENVAKVTEELRKTTDVCDSLQNLYEDTVSSYEETQKVLSRSLKDLTNILIKSSNSIDNAEERNKTIMEATSCYAAIIHSDTSDEFHCSELREQMKKIKDKIDESCKDKYINPKRIIMNGCGGSKAFVTENEKGFNLLCSNDNMTDDPDEYLVSVSDLPELETVLVDSIADQIQSHYINEIDTDDFKEMMNKIPIVVSLKYMESSTTDMYVTGVAALIPFKLFSILKTDENGDTSTQFYKIGDDDSDDKFEYFVRRLFNPSDGETPEINKQPESDEEETSEPSNVDEDEQEGEDEMAKKTVKTKQTPLLETEFGDNDEIIVELKDALRFAKENMSIRKDLVDSFFADLVTYSAIDEIAANDIRESVVGLINDAKEKVKYPKDKKFYSNKLVYVVNKFMKAHSYEIKKYRTKQPDNE